MSELHAPIFSVDTYREVFGMTSAKDIQFAEGIGRALQRLDENLFPLSQKHPFASFIASGKMGLGYLLAALDAPDNQEAKWHALDGIAHIFLQGGATREAVNQLKENLRHEESPEDVALLAKCIAVSGDEAFLREQLQRLGDADPGIVASAARLLGYGGYVRAVPVLCALVSPTRLYEARHVIWALGEIHDVVALPVLHHALLNNFCSVECLIAIGKIGSVISLSKVLAFLLDGTCHQREAAYQALSSILHQNRDVDLSLDTLGVELRATILRQLEDGEIEKTTGMLFHMLLSLARLGEKLNAAQMHRYLKVELDEKEAGEMAAFFMRRNSKDKTIGIS